MTPSARLKAGIAHPIGIWDWERVILPCTDGWMIIFPRFGAVINGRVNESFRFPILGSPLPIDCCPLRTPVYSRSYKAPWDPILGYPVQEERQRGWMARENMLSGVLTFACVLLRGPRPRPHGLRNSLLLRLNMHFRYAYILEELKEDLRQDCHA